MKWLPILVTSFALMMSGVAIAEDEPAEIVKRTRSAMGVLREITGAPDSGIPEEIMDGAECVAGCSIHV